MRKRRLWILVVVVFGFFADKAVVHVQTRLTIPAAARNWDKSRGPLYSVRTAEFGVVPFGQLVRETELILAGSVRVARTYLSDDQMEMYTEFVITPTRVFAQRRSTATKTPGPNPIVVKQWGGRMLIEGVEVIAENATLPLLPTDVPLVLFLSYDEKESNYRIFGGPIGAYVVEKSRMRQLHTPPASYERFTGMDYGQFVRELMQERQAAVK